MSKDKKGFTIIEVVLVLAIAGLIFMMVFVALPSLQRSQRNTQRSDDMSRFLTAVQQYQSNNGGKTPWDAAGESDANNKNFISRYIDSGATFDDGVVDKVKTCTDQFQDPDGTCYGFHDEGDYVAGYATDISGKVENFDHLVHVFTKAGCGSTEGTLSAGSGPREIAMVYVLEGGAIVCNDNH